ncbi:MAG: DUF6662 family protein [Halothiobacillus sp.]
MKGFSRASVFLATSMGFIGAFAPLMITPAKADENLLGYTVGAETTPQGGNELYLWNTLHLGKRQGSYKADYFRLEYERGLTNDLSASFYLNGYSHNYSGSPVPGEIEGALKQTKLSGFSVEMKKMLLSPYKDDLGVALYGELTYDTVDGITGAGIRGWELETKLILQKPFMDGQLQWLTNLELEAETAKDNASGATESAIAPRLRSGVSYRFAPNWSIGAEGWVDMEVLNAAANPDEPGSGGWEFDHWDFFAGPSIHYGAKNWWFTLTWAKQWAGSSEQVGFNNRTDLHLADHERNEVRLKVGYNF